MRSIRRWASQGSRGGNNDDDDDSPGFCCCRSMAFRTPCTRASALGSQRTIMSGSRTSGTPPTLVETTSRPQLAASRMAMQKDSVREQFKNMCPRRKTLATFLCGTAPKKATRSCRCSLSTISCRFSNLLPSPPTMKSTRGKSSHTFGMIPTKRSTPFLYTNRETTTTLILPSSSSSLLLLLLVAFVSAPEGVNLDGSTAFGMTSILLGSSLARRIRLSRQACDTQMAAFRVDRRVVSKTRFNTTPATSSN
mmetsp:Transcript_21425/g.46797  ORF Transcript_21425/g.46797 Transcript_21425/m.46797 type:complete len:251 (+) Transcript_21425:616-1368(+)